MAMGHAEVGYRTRQRAKRARRREIANRDVERAIGRAIRPAKDARRSSSILWCLGASLLLHPTFAFVLSLLPASEARRETYQPVEIHITDPPKPPELPEPEEPPPPPPPPTVERPKVEPPKKSAAPEPEAVPDPVSTDPVEATTTEAPRRVVGISMESTTTGTTGPVLAVGNTRMGTTSNVAQPPAAPAPVAPPSFVPPRRTRAREPVYPSSLRSRNIEGDVGLRVDIDETGRVTRVTVTRRSEHPELDHAAIESASQSTYEPARRDGVAVAYAIEFTVRFRLH